jgi:hypothetical protein
MTRKEKQLFAGACFQNRALARKEFRNTGGSKQSALSRRTGILPVSIFKVGDSRDGCPTRNLMLLSCDSCVSWLN